jgi:hypothetical protein
MAQDEAVLRIVVQDDGSALAGESPDGGPPERVPAPPAPASAAAPPRPPAPSVSGAVPRSHSNTSAFDPLEEARKMREAEVRREQIKIAYEGMYGASEKARKSFDVVVDMATKMRGTLGGVFGPLVGSLLDVIVAVKDMRGQAKSSARIEAERRSYQASLPFGVAASPSSSSASPSAPVSEAAPSPVSSAPFRQASPTPAASAPVSSPLQTQSIIDEANAALLALGNSQKDADALMEKVLGSASKTFSTVEEILRAVYARRTVAPETVQPRSEHKASGGQVQPAPGVPLGADEVPIRATAGEFVVKRDEAQKPHNRAMLEEMNAGHFAEGGVIPKEERAGNFAKWFGNSKVVDDEGKPKTVYHGSSQGVPSEFRRDHPNSEFNLLGPGVYFSENKNYADAAASVETWKLKPGVDADEAARITKENYIKHQESTGTHPSRIEGLVEHFDRIAMDSGIAAAAQYAGIGKGYLFEEVTDKILPAYLSISNPFDADIDKFEGLSYKELVRKYGGESSSHRGGGLDGNGRTIVQKMLRDAGYDGMTHINTEMEEMAGEEGGQRHWVAFHPEQIKSATGNRGTFDPQDPRIHMAKGGPIAAEKPDQAIPEGIQNLDPLPPWFWATLFGGSTLLSGVGAAAIHGLGADPSSTAMLGAATLGAGAMTTKKIYESVMGIVRKRDKEKLFDDVKAEPALSQQLRAPSDDRFVEHFDTGGPVAESPSKFAKIKQFPASVMAHMAKRYGTKTLAASAALGQAVSWGASAGLTAATGVPVPTFGLGPLVTPLIAEGIHRFRDPAKVKQEREEESMRLAVEEGRFAHLPKFDESGAGHYAKGGKIQPLYSSDFIASVSKNIGPVRWREWNKKQPSAVVPRESFDIPRTQMPQIAKEDLPDFVASLEEQGVNSEITTAPVASLKPTQNEIGLEKIAKNAAKTKKKLSKKTIIVSKDDFILDGHHGWAGMMVRDPSFSAQIMKVDLPFSKLLDESRKYKKVGYKEVGQNAISYEDAESHFAGAKTVPHYASGTPPGGIPPTPGVHPQADAVPIMATAGEAVVNKTAYQKPENKRAVDAMNRGQPIPKTPTGFGASGPWALEATQLKVLAALGEPRGPTPAGAQPRRHGVLGAISSMLGMDADSGTPGEKPQPFGSHLSGLVDAGKEFFGIKKPPAKSDAAPPAPGGILEAAGAAVPEIAAVFALVAAAKQVASIGRDIATAPVRAAGSVAMLAADPDANPAKSIAVIGDATKAVGDKLLTINPALGLLASVAGETASSMANLMNAVNATATRYGEYSPVIAQAQAQQEIKQVMGDMRRSQEAGPELARYLQMQGDLQQKFEDIKIKVLLKMLPVITAMGNAMEVIMNVGGSIESAMAIVGNPLAAIASAAKELVNIQADANNPTPGDPTEAIMRDYNPALPPGQNGVNPSNF